ncbi:hypothetical protein EXIGLDRAFT_784667 [Exidia glandulosa HHB12029]|uniref:beta-glucosidase n=1 Tax=Exidia glandulosa HHB12029 TaxID=1314781 RepID=A0A165YYN0_EXIGL|nr:hypothetical protein EXIGLDRAFT_784667 [Exidia glandulosa HHB12029]
MTFGALKAVVFVALAAVARAQQPVWAQCGGIGWNGGTTCVAGATCVKQNDCKHLVVSPSSVIQRCERLFAMHPWQQRTDKYYTHADIILELHHWSFDVDIINLDGDCECVTRPTRPLSLRLTSSPAPTGDWAAALTKAKAAVAKMSTQDKVNLATGIGWMVGACVGNIAAIPSINFPGLCVEDGPLGVRYADLVSAFPA